MPGFCCSSCRPRSYLLGPSVQPQAMGSRQGSTSISKKGLSMRLWVQLPAKLCILCQSKVNVCPTTSSPCLQVIPHETTNESVLAWKNHSTDPLNKAGALSALTAAPLFPRQEGIHDYKVCGVADSPVHCHKHLCQIARTPQISFFCSAEVWVCSLRTSLQKYRPKN